MAFVGASFYKTGKIETHSLKEGEFQFNIKKTSDSSAELEGFELNEVDYDKYGKISILKNGSIVASEFVEI